MLLTWLLSSSESLGYVVSHTNEWEEAPRIPPCLPQRESSYLRSVLSLCILLPFQTDNDNKNGYCFSIIFIWSTWLAVCLWSHSKIKLSYTFRISLLPGRQGLHRMNGLKWSHSQVSTEGLDTWHKFHNVSWIETGSRLISILFQREHAWGLSFVLQLYLHIRLEFGRVEGLNIC